MGFIEIALLACLIVVILWGVISSRDKKWFTGFDGPSLTFPIIGNMYIFKGKEEDGPKVVTEYLRKYNGTCRLWAFSYPTIWTADCKIIKAVLSSTVNIEKASSYEAIGELLGFNGLIASPGSQWRHDRKTFNPSFNKPFLDQTLRYTNNESKVVVDMIKRKMNNKPHMIEPIEIFNECFLKIIVRSLSLSDGEVSKEDVEEYLYILEKAQFIFNIKFFKPWMTGFLWKISSYKKLEDDLVKRILKKMKSVEGKAQNEIGKSDKSTGTFSEDETGGSEKTKLLSETLFGGDESFIWKAHHFASFLGAAMDTTALALQSTLFFLALNPDCQKKVVEEIDSVMGSEEEVTHEHLSQLKYLEMCWKEAMRLHPPVPVIGRKLVEDISLDDGRKILKGTDVIMIMKEAHLNPEAFENPEKFDPSRFSPERQASIKPYTYTPFSMGVRNCIGMKMGTLESKVALVYVIRHFQVATCQTADEILITFVVAGKPFPPIKLSFTERT